MTPYGIVMRSHYQSRGLGQQDLAAKLGVFPSYLSGVEHGSRPPLSAKKTKELARILSLTEKELKELEAARCDSQLRFQLSGGRLNPLQVRLANRFYRTLSALSPTQIERIERELAFRPDVQRPTR